MDNYRNLDNFFIIENFWHLHIGDSTQPHKKYAGTVKNCDFVIVVNFYTVSKTFWIFCVLIISVCKHSDFKFEGKQKCFQYVKNIPKKKVQPHFSQYFAHIKKNLFALKFKILVLTNPIFYYRKIV